MSWESFGALSEFFGATAVVASLLYLSRQLRMTRQVDQTATLSSVVGGFTQHVGQFFSTTDDLALRGLTNRGSLTESERLRFDHLLSSLVSHGEVAHMAFVRGLLSDTDLDLLDWWFREKLFCYPGAREWLKEFEGWFEPSYLQRLHRAAAVPDQS